MTVVCGHASLSAVNRVCQVSTQAITAPNNLVESGSSFRRFSIQRGASEQMMYRYFMYVQELNQRDGKLLRLSCVCCIRGSCGKCFRYFNAIWKCECSLSKNTPDNPRIYSFILRASVIDEMRN
jgi:hypothetical protein